MALSPSWSVGELVSRALVQATDILHAACKHGWCDSSSKHVHVQLSALVPGCSCSSCCQTFMLSAHSLAILGGAAAVAGQGVHRTGMQPCQLRTISPSHSAPC